DDAHRWFAWPARTRLSGLFSGRRYRSAGAVADADRDGPGFPQAAQPCHRAPRPPVPASAGKGRVEKPHGGVHAKILAGPECEPPFATAREHVGCDGPDKHVMPCGPILRSYRVA